MISRGRGWLEMRVLLALSAALLLAPQLIAQQQYTSLPVTEPNSEERKLASALAKGGAASDAAKSALAKVVAAEMSKLTQPGEVERYTAIRMGLYNQYLAVYKPEAAEARKVVIDRIVFYGSGIATSANFSPQSRINALALLAELDDVPAVRTTPPSPARGALAPLFNVARDKNAPLYLRAIALYGLERHISRFFPEFAQNQQRAIGNMLVEIATSEPATELDLPAHAWLVRRAFDCLAATGVGSVADIALARLGNVDELPSVRLAAANYLSKIDASSLSDEQKKNYVLSLAHFARSQFVGWYEHEDDLLKRASGATGGMGGYGGYGGGYGSYGGGGGGDYGGGGYGGGDMYGGGGGDMYGGYGGYGGTSGDTTQNKIKPIETQDWETLLARRKVNQLAQTIYLCLNGMPVKDGQKPAKTGTPLAAAKMPAELEPHVTELIGWLDELQTAVNDPATITDVDSLLRAAEPAIEDLMDGVFEIPGFAEKYPDVVEGEQLETVPDQPEPPPADAPPPGDATNGAPEGNANEQPGGNAPPQNNNNAAPQGNNTPPNGNPQGQPGQ